MPDLMQPDFPLGFVAMPDGTVQLGDTPQDSDQDRKARAAVVISIPRGRLDYEPGIGITPLPFQTSNVNTIRLAGEIQQSDPGLDIDAEETIDMLDHTHRIVSVQVGGRPA